MNISPVVAALVALVLGLALGWFAGRSRDAALRERLAAERRAAELQLATLERAHAQQLAGERAAAAERLEAERDAGLERLADQQVLLTERLEAERAAAVERLESERRAATERLETERAAATERQDVERAQAAARLAVRERELTDRLEAERVGAVERLDELRADQKRLADEFEALSRKALESNSRVFLEQAEERLKRAQESGSAELAKREDAVKQLVEPLSRTLGEVRAEVTAAEKSRLEAHTALAEQVLQMRSSSDLLREETGQLVTALRAPQVRGRWGELQLRRVVEVAGMLNHVDFSEQETITTDDGVQRPDLIVNLPGNKRIVVDAKVAFSGYLEAMEAKDDGTRAKRLTAHARHLRQHIDDLGAKAYWEHVAHSPEFVVMFVPAENFLNAALEQDPTLLERAFEQNVVLATPATLVALLRTVGYTWRQEVLTAEAQQVLTVGRELHKRLSTLGGHLTTLGKRINATVDAFNRFNASLDSQVVTQARRFSALQGLEPAFDAPPPLEVLAVAAHKPDLYGPDCERVIEAEQHELTALIEAAERDARRDAGQVDGTGADATSPSDGGGRAQVRRA